MATGLVEILVVVLGPAIGKFLVKNWLGDSDFVSDASSGIIDLIKSKTTDVLAQRNAARQFEAIGEKIALSLKDVLEVEGTGVDEAGLDHIARNVADTLNKANITAKFLAENSLEPAALTDYLLGTSPVASFFMNPAEKSLYERILLETSQYIIDISSKLPHFNERTFVELFKKQNQLIEVAEEILEEVRRIQIETREPNLNVARFETDYRRSVIRHLDELQLFGLDASSASRRHRLSVAYVTLSVKQGDDASQVDDSSEGEGYLLPTDVGTRDAEDNDERNIQPADEILRRNQKLLIIGDAGSGKTTLLQWTAVRSAQKDFTGHLSDFNDYIPFFIRLRQFVDVSLPRPEDLPGLIAPLIAGTMPPLWAHQHLNDGRAIVLIDGLDELGETRRSQVRDWLKDLVQTFDRARFIVSSRPYAAEADWMESEGFRAAELLPMDLPDIHSFIDHWHNAVRENLQDEERRNELTGLAESLKQKIQKPQIRRLATNPLLCAMLCALHRDRQQILPADRIELYEACLYMLVERRDVERKVDLSDYPNLSYRQKRSLLEELAYWLLKNGYSMASTTQIDSHFDNKLQRMTGVARQDLTGSSVRRLYVERSGVLREPVKGQIDFTHRTFQEFLGAKAALEEGDIGLLVNNAHDQQWREVIILGAGQARAKERAQLITSLIERGDKEHKLRHQLHLLAVACLENSVELDPEVLNIVSARLQSLIPPANMAEAKALASAGELALPYLRPSRLHYAQNAAACVRTLSLIGGEAALQCLSAYATDQRSTVTNELVRGWDYFDREEYVLTIFQRFRSYTLANRLLLERVTSLEGLQHLTNLDNLYIGAGPKVKDLSPLSTLSKLEYLVLNEFPLVESIDSFSKLNNILHLYISYLYKLRDLSPLTSLDKIADLRVISLNQNLDISPIETLTSLKHLTLGAIHQLDDVSGLIKLTGLESLTLNACPRVQNLQPLTNLPNLKRLTVGYMSVEIPEPLREITIVFPHKRS